MDRGLNSGVDGGFDGVFYEHLGSCLVSDTGRSFGGVDSLNSSVGFRVPEGVDNGIDSGVNINITS